MIRIALSFVASARFMMMIHFSNHEPVVGQKGRVKEIDWGQKSVLKEDVLFGIKLLESLRINCSALSIATT